MFYRRENEAQNVYIFHELFAKVNAQVFEKTANNQEQDAKKLLRMLIVKLQGYLNEKYDLNKYENYNLYELLYEASCLERKAGVLPVQIHNIKSTFQKAAKLYQNIEL